MRRLATLPDPVLLLVALGLAGGSWAFNIDTKNAQVHRRPGTGFGYAVDFVYASPRRDKFTLLVGAPFAQTAQRGLRNAGAVYGCETDQSVCAEILFDRSQGNERRLNGSHLLPIEEKSQQMFGATIVASKNADSVLACAPHYKYFFAKFEVIEPVGSCFYSQNYFTNIQEFAPCRQEPARHGHHRFGYGMCGFSAAVPGDGDRRLFISGPGAWYWQGALFSQNVSEVRDRPNTADGPAPTDHHMLGYSTTAGDFNGDGVDDAAVGVPRANELIGMVYIYTEKLRPIINLTDPAGQRGQYFGASVATADVNGDGKADLIVGSPFYTDYRSVFDAKTQERKPRYDIGRVYVYIQSGAAGTFNEPIVLTGHSQWGRFGHAVAAAGDLNGDGYEDFVVGAPFDGEDRRGAIYVYHGATDGVRTTYTQRVAAADVHHDLRTFGFALRGGRDVDRNDYPDIAVGALESSQAVVLRTRPVMQLTGSVRTTRRTINLDEKLCATEFGRISCEKVKLCLKYNGKLQPQFNSIDVRLNVRVDAAQGGTPRAFLTRKDLERKRGVRIHPQAASRDQPDRFEQTVTLSKGREYCETYDVYVPDTIRDKISPILISANYSYVERGVTVAGQLEPAADTTLPQSFDTELIIEKDCGEDNVCVPDLRIDVRPPAENLTLGAGGQTLTLNVSVENKGEDSYLTQFYVDVPAGFEYSGVENYETKHKVSCSPVAADTSAKPPTDGKPAAQPFVCDIGNPLPANARADFGFKITANQIADVKEFVELKMSVNSTISEPKGHEGDNEVVIRVPVEIRAQLYLTGRSTPDQIDYSVRNRTPDTAAVFDFEVGPLVSHLFQVRNRGPSVIESATLDIVWPSLLGAEGRHLLYLIDMPYVNDPAKARCRVLQGHHVNPASLAISGEHVAPPKKEEEPSKDDGEAQEEVRLHPHDDNSNGNGNGRQPDMYDDEDDYDDDGATRRVKRDAETGASSGAGRRRSRLRQQKARLRDAVEAAKAAGAAVNYHGHLSRSTLDCHSLNCTQISCDINRLAPDEFVLVEVFSRLWLNTLIDGAAAADSDIASLALAQITALPHAPNFTPAPQIVAVTTAVNPFDPEQPAGIPWWWVLIAILIALLILTCIILCCYRCGFFKRNRPHMEKAKLSKAGVPPATSDDYGSGAAPDYYADSGARYAPPHQYQPQRHGVRV